MIMTMAVSLPNGAALSVVEAFPSVRPRAADNWLPFWPTAYQATLLVRCPVGHRTDRGLTGDNTRSGRDNRISPPYKPGRPSTCGSRSSPSRRARPHLALQRRREPAAPRGGAIRMPTKAEASILELPP